VGISGGSSSLDEKDYKLLHKSKGSAIEGLQFGGVPVLCGIYLVLLALRAVTCRGGESGRRGTAAEVKDKEAQNDEAQTEDEETVVEEEPEPKVTEPKRSR